jgi:predicted nucleic acid-binding protein
MVDGHGQSKQAPSTPGGHGAPAQRSLLPNSDSPAVRRGGIYDHFSAYRTPNNGDYSAVLAHGMIVLDANVLLDLYRYNKEACDDLLSVLDRLKERLWIPHQVMDEFWHKREEVLQDKRGTVKIIRALRSQCATAVTELRTWAKKAALPKERPAELVEVIEKAFDNLISKIADHADIDAGELSRDTASDPLLMKLESILEGRVGSPLSSQDYTSAVEEAKRRGREKRPPGFRDVGPEGKGPTGDYVLWCETIAEARARREDVLFITGDEKEDWWRLEGKNRRGPRPELAEELRGAADVRLFMLTPDGLLSRASRILNVKVTDESVEAVKRVSSRAFMPWRTAETMETLRARLLDVLEELRTVRQGAAEDFAGDARYSRSAVALRELASYVRECPADDPRLLRSLDAVCGDASLIGEGRNWHLAIDRYGFDWQLDPSDGLDMLADAIEADHVKNTD